MNSMNEYMEPFKKEEDEEHVNFIEDRTILSQHVPNLSNVILIRAELSDFWRCILLQKEKDFLPSQSSVDKQSRSYQNPSYSSNWNIVKHYLLYPNPYPKISRLKSRWYAHPAFPLILNLISRTVNQTPEKFITDNKITKTNELIVRSNWKGYLSEFATASLIYANKCTQKQKEEKERDSDGCVGNSHFCNNDCFEAIDISGPYQLQREELEIPITNFEKKFTDWGEPVYELRISMKKF